MVYWINLTRRYHQKTHTSRATADTTATLHLAALTLNASGCFPWLHKGDILCSWLHFLFCCIWFERKLWLEYWPYRPTRYSEQQSLNVLLSTGFSSLHCSVSLPVSIIIFNAPWYEWASHQHDRSGVLQISRVFFSPTFRRMMGRAVGDWAQPGVILP